MTNKLAKTEVQQLEFIGKNYFQDGLLLSDMWFRGFPDGSEDGKSPPGQCRRHRLGRSPGVGNGNSAQAFLSGKSMDRGAWQIIVNGVTELDTTERMVHV